MLNVRTVELQDAENLVNIYRPYVEHTAITFDYTVPSVHEFEEKISKSIQSYPFLVAEEGDDLLGYAYASEFYPKDAYKLYNELEKQLYDRGICRLTSCIAYPDEGSVSFHEKRGFRRVAHFEKVGYKFNRWYDVVWYQKDIREDIK